MTLDALKTLAIYTILSMTYLSGIVSIRFAIRFEKQLEIGDAIANGIFIGTALFHLIPSAAESLRQLGSHAAYVEALTLTATSFIVLWLIENKLLQQKENASRRTNIFLLIITLSIHALLTGIALGISETFSTTLILFIAVLAHKGFETFALMVNLSQQLSKKYQLRVILILFSLITPLGIPLGMISDTLLQTQTDNLLTACFSAFAAGTFIYIGTVHSHHLHHTHAIDRYKTPTKIIATLIGVSIMGVIAIWI